MARPRTLGAWLYGTRIAELTSSRPGEVRCRYTSDALDRWPLNTPLLSCSLPLTTRRLQAGLFFRGVLPEGDHLLALAAQAKVASYDTFGLLARFGKDIVGAIVVAADEPPERGARVEPYRWAQLEADVASLPERPLAIHDDSDLSLPGLQDKLLLVDMGGGKWGRPVHGYPSTHILKVEDRRYQGMAEREAGCLQLAKAVGLTSVDVQVRTIADFPCLIVSRFDRAVGPDGQVVRLHQEDACQALDRDPEADRGRGKYERSGGPALADVAGILERYSTHPQLELERLAQVATFTVAIGNADAHGKNIGLLHREPGVVSLAPLYDTVPTVLWPHLRTAGAMTVNHRAELGTIGLDYIGAEARRWRLSPVTAVRSGTEIVQSLLEAVKRGPALPDDLAKAVTARCQRLLATA